MRFDIETYKARTGRLEWADLDLADAFGRRPLGDDALRCLRYMHDVEFHTVCYLRDLLLTPAHEDPEITAFLSFWVYEEFWHGEAIADVLAAHGEPAGGDRVANLRRSLRLRQRLGPLAIMAASRLLGDDFIALHMTWGAINEWTTQAGYARLTHLAGHPTLNELLGRIMRQEGRHIDFYLSQAERRLNASRQAQRVTRLALRRLWQPVGGGVMPPEEIDFLARHLFSGDDGRQTLRRIDRRIDRLPGLGGLHLLERAVDERSPSPRQPEAVAAPNGNVIPVRASDRSHRPNASCGSRA
jgi:hypothetical protein